jgi:Major Facilitator Superfamily
MPFRLPRFGPSFSSATDRRNYLFGVANGIFSVGAEAFVQPHVVMTYFASLLTDSRFLVGLVAPLRLAGWYLPQLLMAGYVQRRERNMPLYRVLAVVRTIAWFMLISMLWFVQDRVTVLVMFFVMIALTRLAEGTAGLSFLSVVAKVIPPGRRGAFFSHRQLYGGLLAVGCSIVTGWLLSAGPGLAFPRQFALLFALYTLLVGIAIYSFARVHEPAEAAVVQPVGVMDQLRRARELLNQDRNYGRFLLARLLMVVADAAIPFYVVYAREQLAAPGSLVGVYLSTMTLSALTTNLWAGRISDRRGNRRLLLTACLIGLAGPAVSLLLGGYHASPLLFTVVFALNGVYNTSAALAHTNFLLDIAPPGDRPIYYGTANTLIGVGILVSSGGGALVDWLGYTALFTLALLVLLLAGGVVFTIRDPVRN